MIKIVGKDKNILTTDTLRFILDTTDGNDCPQTPYQITTAKIYFIAREFTDSTVSVYNAEFKKEDWVSEYERIKNAVCLKAKQMVKAATVSSIALSGEQEIDGIDLVIGDRVLVKNQEDRTKNGIYIVSDSSWTRSLDADSGAKVVPGMYVFVEEGIQNIDTGWVLENSSNFILGISDLNFLLFSKGGSPQSPDEKNEENLQSLSLLKKKIDESKIVSPFFYKNAVTIKVFGGHIDPLTGEVFNAWLNPDMVPSELKSKVMEDNMLIPYYENNEVAKGKFILDWEPLGCREGDYFICWSWRPNLSSEVLSSHMFFTVEGNGKLTSSIPTHYTKPEKYEILLGRYLPDMFKNLISENDLSPQVLQEFNNSVAKGFTFVENLANQIIDLLDSNSTHEQLLPLLANMFNLRIKSSDPTLWRRQIKKAIPNFKKKGSIVGLKEALGDIGMKFLKLTGLWQVVSKYTHQEHFKYNGSEEFILSKQIVLPLDETFKLWIRTPNGEWEDLGPSALSSSSSSEHWSSQYVSFSGKTMTWIGDDLHEGYSIRVLYKTKEIPAGEKSIDNYIRTLPLMDDRDERSQKFPLKNWNVRLIEEDDPLFDLIVPVRHPIADPVIWGKVRTEFPYSENAYNMDEYNGSKRDSIDPCDIDRDFLDSCSQCKSSKFNLDLEVESLSNDSFQEAMKIAEEYMPFHAVVNSYNLSGAINEFIRPAAEDIRALVTYSKWDAVLAGEGQLIFNRTVDDTELENVKRNILASFSAVTSPLSGSLKNKRICLFATSLNPLASMNEQQFKETTQSFDTLSISTGNMESTPSSDAFDNDNLLELIGSNTSNYSIEKINNSSAWIYGDVDTALIGPVLEYRVSNKILDATANITQVKQIIFNDEDYDFSMLGIVTQYDIDFNSIDKDVWEIRYQNKKYNIQNLLPDGSMLLGEESSITPISGWEITNGTDVIKYSSGGVISVYNYGLVEITSPTTQVKEKLKIGDYIYMDWSSSISKYRIRSFKNGENKFFLEDYNEGSMAGKSVKVYRRVIEKKVGQLGYEGIILEASQNIENLLSISNGVNYDPSNVSSYNVKENYLIFVDSEYYTISEIDGNKMVLEGPLGDHTLDGESVGFIVYKFNKENLSLEERILPVVPGYDFNQVDRSGAVILKHTGADQSIAALSFALNSINSNEPIDVLTQGESIEYNIEYKEE